MRLLAVLALFAGLGLVALPVAAEAPFCATHGVPEAVCTRCKPKLAAVFKAKGNWCAEHQLPESFCPVCHPERGGRPPAALLAADPAPAHGTRVRLASPEVAGAIGLETVKAVERPSSSAILATARLAYEASRTASVNALAAGVVREIRVEVGTRVERGATLAVIDSTAVGADRSRLAAARTRLQVATAGVERERILAASGISARRDLLSAEQEWSDARAEHRALQAGLSAVGDSAASPSAYSLTAPISGLVTSRELSLGQLVDPGRTLFAIVDSSSLIAELDLPEAEASWASVGQTVVVTFSSLPGREFTGSLTYLAPEVDSRTQTVRGRVLLRNPDGLLRANMFGQARLLVAPRRSAIVVPRSAVQRVAGVPLVFVQLAADRYETRRVKMASRTCEPAWVELDRGVRSGEAIVTTGSYQLKTETIKSSIGAGCCEKD